MPETHSDAILGVAEHHAGEFEHDTLLDWPVASETPPRVNSRATYELLPKLDLTEQEKLVSSDHLLASAKTEASPAEKHKITSRFLSLGYKFDIASDGGTKEGTIEEKVISLTTTFSYKDQDGKLVATGTKRLFSWGAQIDVTDADGKPIGSIKEHVFSSLLKPYSFYSILDKDGKEIATSEKLQLFSTNFTLKDTKGKEIATLHRGAFQILRDKWDISITEAAAVPKSLLYMIPAYKTTADGRKSSGGSSRRKK